MTGLAPVSERQFTGQLAQGPLGRGGWPTAPWKGGALGGGVFGEGKVAILGRWRRRSDRGGPCNRGRRWGI